MYGSTQAREVDIGMGNYIDYQSSRPVDPRVIEAMIPYFRQRFGNPSSLHTEGDEATKVLEECRKKIAGFIHAKADEIIFTSGATEANNLALIGYAMRNRGKGNHIVISEVEHISIHNIVKYLEKEGFKVSRLPVDQYGKISVKKLASALTPQTILISIGYASNEIGTIQPIAEIGAVARERGIAFHTDAVAAEGLVPLDVLRDQFDLLTLSSNDIYGPPGIGVLYAREGIRLNPLIIGGGQERGLRSGTENMPGIVGMSAAAEIMDREMPAEVKRLTGYRDKLIKNLLTIPKSHLNGHPIDRLANNVHVRFEAIEGESLILALRDEGISAATGSACSSKTLEPSHTLISTGLLHEEAHGSLEFTFGRFNTEEDVDRIIAVLPAIVARLRRLSPLYER
jgi:cysteine desulfurase